MPGATAKSVGLTAATTVPCADTSRTNGPSVTVAMRRRSREIVFAEALQPRNSIANTTTSSTAPAAMPIFM